MQSKIVQHKPELASRPVGAVPPWTAIWTKEDASPVPRRSAEVPKELSSRKFLGGCLAASLALSWIGRWHAFPSWVLALEVLLTVIALFIFGSSRYRLNKNALTYGAALVIAGTFLSGWWPGSALRQDLGARGIEAFGVFLRRHFFSLQGLDGLVHADTMLFILGLTFFVAVITQTRVLETASFAILRKNKGLVVPTVAIIAGLVSIASGILDGVSMIGLMIRTLAIILFLSKADDEAVAYAVMVSTVITTVCGMWLAYGEPPNLIMKANLHPHLTNGFFLRYCLPVAIGSYLIVLWNVHHRLRGRRIHMKELDVLDVHTADIRFLQASRHGEVLTPIEFLEDHRAEMGSHFQPVLMRLHKGEPLGKALFAENVPADIRKKLLGQYVSEDLAAALDRHYLALANNHGLAEANAHIQEALDKARRRRVQAQWVGGLAFIPFVGLLVWHAFDHQLPLFWASFAGFAVAILGTLGIPKMRRLALSEARHEYAEYLFLFPLFLSITLLQKSGFFGYLAHAMQLGTAKLGAGLMAFLQFTGAAFLSAILDNNVVADFTARSIHGLGLGLLHLFAMAQIAGYAAGGCWTPIGSAQSVVAYAFVRKEVDEHSTPMEWIKRMTPIILEIFVLMAFVIGIESAFIK